MQEKFEKSTLYDSFTILYNTKEKKDETLAVFDRFTNRQLAKSWDVRIEVIQSLRKWLVGSTSY